MKPLVINFQKCSIHDGPGIRSTVFFKGCPLECVWCHNPESQSYKKEVLYNRERCGACGKCKEICPHDAIFMKDGCVGLDKDKCELCSTCLDYCINNAREIVGDEYTVKELLKLIDKDRIFYEESGGGVTLSGGEVMVQDMDFICELAKGCKNKGIDVAIDTCGYAPTENYERILPYADRFLFDIKLVDEDKHKKFTGKSNDLILKNLKFLNDNGAFINIRIPLIGGVNVDDDNEEVMRMIELLKPLNIKAVNLLPYHDIGTVSYTHLTLPTT